MILILASLLAAAGPADPRTPQARFDACVKESDSNPQGAEKMAAAWAGQGGGVLAAQCLGIARSAKGEWQGAVDAFTAGASLAEQTHDARASTLWTSAGNAALAAGDAAGARAAFDKAMAAPGFEGPVKGEALLDRARAEVALNDDASARADIDVALPLIQADPMAWLLSATLARRMGDMTRAAADIKEAALRAPDEAAVLYEAGNIAAAQGHIGDARAQWARAKAADPRSAAGQAAARELDDTGAQAGDAKRSPAPQGR
ncbi:MAG TPA: hypothetical protein VFL92_10775 [Sphingomonas sp.]|nr:hypothetical protein [Sphingomonas sp.]